MSTPVVSRRPWSAFAWVTLAYIVAIAVAGVTLRLVPSDSHVLFQVAAADLAATLAVFAFSRGLVPWFPKPRSP